jgi:membrane-associated phospholipid phosphatase
VVSCPNRGAVVGEYLVGILRADQGTLGRNVIGVWPAPDGDGGEERLPTRIQSIRSPTGRAGTEERGDVVGRVRRDLIVLAASLAVFAVCAVVVADGRVGSAERVVFHAVNGLPGWLYRPMLVAQYLGVLAMPLVVAVGALAFRRWRLAAALVLVVPLKLAAEKVVKQLVQRERPGTTVPDALLRGVHPGGLSFVSGHAIITLAIAGLLALVLPRRWAIVAFVLAALNAVARVYLGAHNPLDVVGGAAVGLAIAAVLDLVLDVACVREGSRRGGPMTPAGEDRST